MVLPRRRKKRKNNDQNYCRPCHLVFIVQFVLIVTMLATRTTPNKSSKRRTLRSHPTSKRSQPSYELPFSSSINHPSEPFEQESQSSNRDYSLPFPLPVPQSSKPDGNELPFRLPVPRDMPIETILPRLVRLFRKARRKYNRLVNLGAGVRDQDPTFPLLDDPNDQWKALLLDGAEHQGKSMAERFPSEKIKTAVAYITADSIPDVLSQHGFDHDIDLLKIDIDSFDCLVVDSLLKVVRPSVIVMEVNVKFPANVRFAFLPGFPKKDETSDSSTKSEQYPFDSEKRGHIYGCSLAYQVHDLMRPNDYEILYLETNNAVYFDKRKAVPGLKDYTPLSMADLYERGYWNMPDRRSRFGFNNELEIWQTYKADQIFSHLEWTDLVSHGHHKIVIGDLVNDGKGPQPPLQRGYFLPDSGKLMKLY